MIGAVPEEIVAFAPEKDMGKRGGKTNRMGKHTCDVSNVQDKRKTAPLYPPLGPKLSVWLQVAAGCGCHRCGSTMGRDQLTPVLRVVAAWDHWPRVATGGGPVGASGHEWWASEHQWGPVATSGGPVGASG